MRLGMRLGRSRVVSGRSAEGDAEELPGEVCVREEGGSVSAVDDPSRVEDHDGVRDAPHQRQVLFHEQDRGAFGDPGQHVRHLGDELGRETLGGFVDEEQHVVAQQNSGQGDHLLLASGESAGPLLATGYEVGEQLADHWSADPDVASDEAEVLVDGEPAEHVAVLGYVADASADQPEGLAAPDVVALQGDSALPRRESEKRLEGGGLADAVPSEQGGDPSGGYIERDALEDVGPAVADVEVLDAEDW